MLGKIWTITSYEEYVNDYKSTAGAFIELTTFQKKIYNSPKDFFNTQAYLAQQIANDRVGQIIENVFNSEDLPKNIQSYLKQFTYRAIDYLRINDLIIGELDRVNTSTYNGGRVDTTSISPKYKVENLIGSAAWRAWNLSKIEDFYYSYCEQIGIPYLLDPERFYNKDEIDKFLNEYDKKLQDEHQFADLGIKANRLLIEQIKKELVEELNLKQNKSDQILYQQASDDSGNPTGPVEKLGEFDEILEISSFPANAIVKTPDGKNRAVLNHNIIGEIKDAVVTQTTSETDVTNAIGRVWGYGIENNLTQAKNDIITNKTSIGDISQLTTDQKDNLTNAINSTNDKFNLEKNRLYKEIENGKLISGKQYIVKWSMSGDGSNFIYYVAKIYFLNVSSTGSINPVKVINFTPEYKCILDNGTSTFYLGQTKPSSGSNDGLIEVIIKNDGSLFYEKIEKIWEYQGSDEMALSITFDKPLTSNINFTAPGSYWEKQYAIEQEELEKERKKREIAKLSDLKPLEDKISEIKPIVDDLQQKDEHRMKTLGLHPDYKYYKKNEGDDS